ncbi:unnamed protein product, partial [Porites lobata]
MQKKDNKYGKMVREMDCIHLRGWINRRSTEAQSRHINWFGFFSFEEVDIWGRSSLPTNFSWLLFKQIEIFCGILTLVLGIDSVAFFLFPFFTNINRALTSGGTRTRLGAHHLGKVMFKSSQPRPCWAVEALPLRSGQQRQALIKYSYLQYLCCLLCNPTTRVNQIKDSDTELTHKSRIFAMRRTQESVFFVVSSVADDLTKLVLIVLMNLFLQIAGKIANIAKIRTRKSFVPHGKSGPKSSTMRGLLARAPG